MYSYQPKPSGRLKWTPSLFRAGLIGLGLLALGCGVWFVIERGSAPPEIDPEQAAAPTRSAAPMSPPTATGGATAIPSSAPVPPPLDEDHFLITDILLDERYDMPATAARLLQLLPRLQPEQQEEAAHHIANLTDDPDAGEWSRKLAADDLPPAAAEVFFNDLLNRSDEFKYPTLAAIADQPDHSLHEDSVEILEILFGEPEPGHNWRAWVELQLQD